MIIMMASPPNAIIQVSLNSFRCSSFGTLQFRADKASVLRLNENCSVGRINLSWYQESFGPVYPIWQGAASVYLLSL
jgi:hypothetical protein